MDFSVASGLRLRFDRRSRQGGDLSNLGMFLNRLRQNPQTRKRIVAALRDLYEGLSDFEFTIEQGTVQVFFTLPIASGHLVRP